MDLPTKANYDIFISYHTTHSDWVDALAHNLVAQGYSLFLDRWSLIPGKSWAEGIYEALNNSRCAILFATPDASDSGWVQQELEVMLARKNSDSGFFFIPVVMGSFPDLPFVETIEAVDFGNSQPEQYRQAFHRLLCGLEQKPPGPDSVFTGDLQLPKPATENERPLVQGERSFLDQVFTQLECGQPLMLLTQADTDTQIYGQALRKQAESLYGADNVFHIFPPNSARADSPAYFGRLARQCGLEREVSESWQWAEALAEQLDGGRKIFLLVTGFESGADESRAELAGELRQLNECYPGFRPVMMGGARLAALKYANGSMSLLNNAEEITIPELDNHDLHKIFGQRHPQLTLSAEQLQQLLAFTGGHPRLLQYCLQQGADSTLVCEQILKQSSLPAQLFTRFREEQDRLSLCNLLNQSKLGRYDPWPGDELLRRLYWNNLITQREQTFVWRCEFIRQTGQEILACT